LFYLQLFSSNYLSSEIKLRSPIEISFISYGGSKSTVAKKNEAEIQETTNGFSLGNFFQGLKEEFEKVVWPSRRQLVSESAAVLLMVSLSASVLFLVDKFFTWAAQQVFG
jgi:preprotein translocase subunit SecE